MQEGIAVENRRLILNYISDNPGSHQRKIARDLDIRLSTLRYHLDYLENKRSIVCQKQDNLKIYFVYDKIKPHEKVLIPLLQQKHYREIILVLISSPGLTFSQIVNRLSIGASTASKYINILEDRKILFHKKFGREKKYYLNDEKSVVGLLRTYKNFMADMSFEIRTPMNTIMGMTSLLIDEKLTPEQRDFVETIKASGEALMVLIDDILDFSKIEREKIELEVQTFDLRNCIEFPDCHVFFNYFADKDKACLRLEAYGGITEEEARRMDWLDYGVAICGNVARDGQRIVAENIPETPDPRTDLVKSFGICAYACHPLMNQGKVIGTLSFGTRSRSTFTKDDLDTMKTVADNISKAMARIKAGER
jgi:DNA-binding MarR family transcriptional regulator/putative methionine-R-sulfoxide reductase with GAF domain